MAELKKFDFDHVMPIHCSEQNFADLATSPRLPTLKHVACSDQCWSGCDLPDNCSALK